MYNLTAYITYLIVVVTAILYVGHLCYKYGHVYVAQIIPEDPQLTHQVNKILLAGYYLLNIGYGIYAISIWDRLHDLIGVIESVITHLAYITLILAAMHYFNMLVINIILKQKSNTNI